MKGINQEELDKILELHRMWLNDERGGKRANLSYANLREANLRYANLSYANLSYANLSYADLSYADLSYANLRYANLEGADLEDANLIGTNLRYADLKDADLDYSCLPLCCGSLETNFDDKQLTQIAYHLVRAGLQSKNASEETKKELSKLINFANKFHKVDECGEIEEEDEGEKKHE